MALRISRSPLPVLNVLKSKPMGASFEKSGLRDEVQNLFGPTLTVTHFGQGSSRAADGSVWHCQAYVLQNPYSKPRCVLTFNDLDHRLVMGVQEWDRSWVETVIRAFLDYPALREAFRDGRHVVEPEDASAHPEIWVHAPYNGPVLTDQSHWGWIEAAPFYHDPMRSSDEMLVDEHLAPALKKLNASGCRTIFSCQGDQETNVPLHTVHDGGTAYLTVHPQCAFPQELKTVWEGLGFYMDESTANLDRGFRSVYAQQNCQVYGQQRPLNTLFTLVLNDWAHDQLDLSLERYKPLLHHQDRVRPRLDALIETLELTSVSSTLESNEERSAPSRATRSRRSIPR